jgi:hypothetical protein
MAGCARVGGHTEPGVQVEARCRDPDPAVDAPEVVVAQAGLVAVDERGRPVGLEHDVVLGPLVQFVRHLRQVDASGLLPFQRGLLGRC